MFSCLQFLSTLLFPIFYLPFNFQSISIQYWVIFLRSLAVHGSTGSSFTACLVTGYMCATGRVTLDWALQAGVTLQLWPPPAPRRPASTGSRRTHAPHRSYCRRVPQPPHTCHVSSDAVLASNTCHVFTCTIIMDVQVRKVINWLHSITKDTF